MVTGLKRIDQYVCIDVEDIVREEMRWVLEYAEEQEAQEAAEVILKYYSAN